MAYRTALAILGLAMLSGLAVAAAAPTRRTAARKPAARADAFASTVAPFLAKYCTACHSGDQAQAGVNLARFSSEAAALKDRALWDRVARTLKMRRMPPRNMRQPTDSERQRVIGWIDQAMTRADCDLRDPGRVTMRRLNRAEYNNTIRDLFGIDLRPADEFPSDEVGYGFDNIGDVLSISPILMEKYLAAAEKIVDQAIVTPDPKVTRYEAERLPQAGQGGAIFIGSRLLTTNSEVYIDHAFLTDGEYRIRARAWGHQAGDEPVKMAFRLDGQDLAVVEVPVTEGNARLYEQPFRTTAGKHRLAVAFTNDFYDPSQPRDRRDRNLLLDYIEIVGPMNVGLPPQERLPASHRRIFIARPGNGVTPEDAARKILRAFLLRCYRRPPTPAEVERSVGIVRAAMKEGDSFERGIQLAIQAALVSPHFLFRVEVDPQPHQPNARRLLNDWELATRLSYFLWSSMPDDQLFTLAEKGLLKKPEVLEAQALRMLRDPKSRALVENFGMQWLTLRNLENFNPDPKLFPNWDEQLRQAMYRETELFFEAIIREDRSVLDLLDARFTFVNERLAKHYGIPGVQGEEFRRVSLEGTPRQGVLTHASILCITSNPTRTSPVKRGKWVMEQILGTPPPPPLPDVPPLDDPNQKLTGTLRQRMEQHRQNPMCASCHEQMDAIGFGLENFDAIGAWRTRDGDAEIDASGTLPDGSRFRGPLELIAVLKKDRDSFVRHFVGQLLTFALGRGLEYFDRCAVDGIAAASARKGYRFSAIVTEIVKSEPFRMRRGDGGM